MNHAPGSYVYTMGILYGANFNMAERTAGQLELTLRVSNACARAKAFEARTNYILALTPEVGKIAWDR